MPDINIFDLQRCSFVDGPGIRTTVFFKGCNLRCKWCHNPESWSAKKQLAYFAARCVQCGACKAVCGAQAVKDDFFPDPALCSVCGECVEHCPASARKIYGQAVSVDSLMETLLSDRLFYETSGGGVTCSGGECMLQLDGLCELLTRLKAEGIHTAVDTAGSLPWSSFERILPVTDLFLYDIKCLDAQLHRELTGADNALILDNYKRLLDAKAHVFVRVPVVPGSNDVAQEMERIADFLARYAPEKTEFLPYHRMGESKGAAIGQQGWAGEIPENARIEALMKRVQKGT